MSRVMGFAEIVDSDPRVMSSCTSITPDLRTQLRTLWNVLAALGAVVRRHDVDALPDDVIQALCDHEATRIRALTEGAAAGWHPSSRSTSTSRAVARATPGPGPNRSEQVPAHLNPAPPGLSGPAQARQRTTGGLRRCTAGALTSDTPHSE